MPSRRLAFFATSACLAGVLSAAGCGDASNLPVPDKGVVSGERVSPGSDASPPSGPMGLLPVFRMVGRESGFDFERTDDIRGRRSILEANGGGVGLVDFDRDSLPDIFMTNGCRLPLKLADHDSRSALFRNRGKMQFEEIADRAFLLHFGYAHGCAAGDYDADGFDDLYVTAYGPNSLWRNNGDGTFTDVADFTGCRVPQWSSSAAFADVNGDGHLDLYVVNYLDESDESPKVCPNPKSPDGREQCPPAMFRGVDDVLFLSDGEGKLIDASAESGIAGLGGNGLGVLIADLDGDGSPEIFVSNDGEANFLLVRDRDGSRGTPADAGRASLPPVRFVNCALESGVALNASGYAQANMGIAAGDCDGNGTTDLFITTFFGDTNTLFANRGKLLFEDRTRGTGLGSTSRDKLGFGTVFLDADNDGWLDLFVANGHVDDRTWARNGEPYRMRPQMYRNEHDGRFEDVSGASGDYFTKEWLGRGVSMGDLDLDGKVDLVVSHQLAPSTVLHNETPTNGRSLVLRLIGIDSNRNGYGARVELIDAGTTVVRELSGGGSYQAALAQEIHLGLGESRQAAVRIVWPSGKVDTHLDVSTGTWTAREGQRLMEITRE